MYRLRFDYVNIKIINKKKVFFCARDATIWLVFIVVVGWHSIIHFNVFRCSTVQCVCFCFDFLAFEQCCVLVILCLLLSWTIYIIKREQTKICLSLSASVKQMRGCHAKMRCTNNRFDSENFAQYEILCVFFHFVQHERTFLFKFNLAVLLQILRCFASIHITTRFNSVENQMKLLYLSRFYSILIFFSFAQLCCAPKIRNSGYIFSTQAVTFYQSSWRFLLAYEKVSEDYRAFLCVCACDHHSL